MKFPRFASFYHSLTFSRHALQRATELAGRLVEPEELRSHLDQAVRLSHAEVRDRGFRPAYQQRRDHGIKSWYFEGDFLGWEVLFVFTEDRGDSTILVCVTIYARDRQNELLDRATVMESALAAAGRQNLAAMASSGCRS